MASLDEDTKMAISGKLNINIEKIYRKTLKKYSQ